MGATSFKNYITYFLLAGVFLIALVSFGTGIKENYNQDTDVIDSDKIDLTQLNETLRQTSEDAKDWEQAFTSDILFVALGAIVLFSLWGIFKLLWTAMNTLATIYLQGINNVLGVDPMVTGVATALLIIGLIFAVWKNLKTGE